MQFVDIAKPATEFGYFDVLDIGTPRITPTPKELTTITTATQSSLTPQVTTTLDEIEVGSGIG